MRHHLRSGEFKQIRTTLPYLAVADVSFTDKIHVVNRCYIDIYSECWGGGGTTSPQERPAVRAMSQAAEGRAAEVLVDHVVSCSEGWWRMGHLPFSSAIVVHLLYMVTRAVTWPHTNIFHTDPVVFRENVNAVCLSEIIIFWQCLRKLWMKVEWKII